MQNSGIILLNKPTKISSNSAVNKVKYLINAKKAGHLGTLDPLASGVLPITFGKATRLFDYFLTKQKTYKAVFVFGFETSTLDCEGQIAKLCDCEITEKQINSVIDNFKGEIEQKPPQFSAIKINGQKAYDLARNGEKIELKSRKITIHEINFHKIDDIKQIESLFNFFVNSNKDENLKKHLDKIKNYFFKNAFEFEITCSAGTYIRSIVRDIANFLNCYGTMVSLERIKCGEFDIDNCYTFEQIEKGEFKILNSEEVINLEKIEISFQQAQDLLCGKVVLVPKFQGLKKLYSNNEFLGIASAETGKLKINVYLKEE